MPTPFGSGELETCFSNLIAICTAPRKRTECCYYACAHQQHAECAPDDDSGAVNNQHRLVASPHLVSIRVGPPANLAERSRADALVRSIPARDQPQSCLVRRCLHPRRAARCPPAECTRDSLLSAETVPSCESQPRHSFCFGRSRSGGPLRVFGTGLRRTAEWPH